MVITHETNDIVMIFFRLLLHSASPKGLKVELFLRELPGCQISGAKLQTFLYFHQKALKLHLRDSERTYGFSTSPTGKGFSGCTILILA